MNHYAKLFLLLAAVLGGVATAARAEPNRVPTSALRLPPRSAIL